MKKLLDLFTTFFKIGLFTFGGGYAMIGVVEHKCVEEKKWITHEEMMNVTVIAETTPGPVAVNLSTYVGYQQAGILGSLISTLGIVSPSFIIIYVISMYLDDFLSIKIVSSAFNGIKIGVGLLIFNAGIKMLKNMDKNVLSYLFMITSLIIMMMINIYSLNISSIVLLILAGFLSLSILTIKERVS